ncbi:hypothetical protein PF007_g5804 [Phytophthora fragariae]|uniref:Uncharacterized protein n=1 Tax=Phytophthora fragariae TaxID=53985 RepID=A0A6A3T016_9STRA|nr:hypothetical protein PF007_g5804 [Phytophthora fragariae]
MGRKGARASTPTTSDTGVKRSKKTTKKALQPKPKEQATAEATGLPRRLTLRARAPVDYVLATHGFIRDDSDDGDYQPDEDPDDGVDDEMQDLGDAESPLTGDSDAGGETLAMAETLTLAKVEMTTLTMVDTLTLAMLTVAMLTVKVLEMVIVEMLTLVMLTMEALALMLVEVLTVKALAMAMVEMLTVEALAMLTDIADARGAVGDAADADDAGDVVEGVPVASAAGNDNDNVLHYLRTPVMLMAGHTPDEVVAFFSSETPKVSSRVVHRMQEFYSILWSQPELALVKTWSRRTKNQSVLRKIRRWSLALLVAWMLMGGNNSRRTMKSSTLLEFLLEKQDVVTKCRRSPQRSGS